MTVKGFSVSLIAVVFFMFFGNAGTFSLSVPFAFAHCDTMDGPVIKAAQKALETGKPDPALIWVKEEDAAAIRAAFEKTLSVRKLGPEAKGLADMYFFETLIRIHRAGEGEPYTGIKPAGPEVEPGIKAADEAIEKGAADDLVKEYSEALSRGIRHRFEAVMEKKKHMNESVGAGREFVEAYVPFIHYVEKLEQVFSCGCGHGEGHMDESMMKDHRGAEHPMH